MKKLTLPVLIAILSCVVFSVKAQSLADIKLKPVALPDSAARAWIDSFFTDKQAQQVGDAIIKTKRWIRGLETYRLQKYLDHKTLSYKLCATCDSDGTLIAPDVQGTFGSFDDGQCIEAAKWSEADRQRMLAQANYDLSLLRRRYRELTDH